MTRKKGFSCIDCRIEKAAGEKKGEKGPSGTGRVRARLWPSSQRSGKQCWPPKFTLKKVTDSCAPSSEYCLPVCVINSMSVSTLEPWKSCR